MNETTHKSTKILLMYYKKIKTGCVVLAGDVAKPCRAMIKSTTADMNPQKQYEYQILMSLNRKKQLDEQNWHFFWS